MLILNTKSNNSRPGNPFATTLRKLTVTGLTLLVAAVLLAAPAESRAIPPSNAQRTYSGDELRDIHPTDLWEAVKMIDPSVMEIDENLYGSDPNAVPQQVDLSSSARWQRGGTMPVFILDGAVVSVRRIRDLDIRLVQSVSIRNDAAALTGWGLRGGNGVIEITTIHPEAWPLRLDYSFDGSLQWADLDSYRPMNSTQKLALEKSAGLYADLPMLLAEREGGADKDWLRVPLRTAFQNRHLLNVSGGDQFVKYAMSLRLAPSAHGVMRGSKRDVYGADAYIEYRYRSLVISNRLGVDKIYARESDHGALDYYSSINPYYFPADPAGILYTTLGAGTFNEQINPLYEASLGSFSKAEAWALSDNLCASLNLGAGFRLDGRFSFAKEKEQTDLYIAPSSGIFTGREISEAGRYDIGHRNHTTYEGDVSLRYDGQGDRAQYGAILSGNVFRGESDRDYYGGTGIPSDRMGFISFTTAYNPALMPDAVRRYERTFAGLLSAWYEHDGRYRVDVSARIDRSSRLARDRQSAWFYGVSAAWNIHNETFLREAKAVHRLTLQAAMSTTGAIDFTEADHTVMYSYNTGNEYIYDYFLIGAGIRSLPNPRLRPRTNHHRNMRLSAETRWFSADLNWFCNTSKDLTVLSPTALATGYDDMPSNGGAVRTSGLAFSFRSQSIWVGDMSLRIYANGIHRKSIVKSVPDYFREKYNVAVADNFGEILAAGLRPSLLTEGESADAIWAVRSAGIDASGRETFIDRNGEKTSVWNAADLVPVGDATPWLRGTLGVQAGWRDWSAQVHVNYSLGGEIYNETLHNVQNGSPALNGDRRMAATRMRANNPEQILATSRFVETNNEFSLGSVRVGYLLPPRVAEKLKMKSLEINLTGNRLIHSSSADYQRGIYYPYARTVTLSINAKF